MSFRIFGKNAAIYLIGNVALRLVSFILIPFYTRYLSLNEYGLLEIMLVSAQLLAFIMSLGMADSFLRFYKEHAITKTVDKLMGSTLLSIVFSGIVTTILCLALLPRLFNTIFHIESGMQMLSLACGAAFTQTLVLQLLAYFRARNEALKYAVSSIITAVFILLSIIIFVISFRMGVAGVFIAQIVAYLILILCLSLYIIPKTRLSCSGAAIRENVIFGFPLIFALCGWHIMAISDRYFLSYFESLAIVGIYSLGMKISHMLYVIIVRPFSLAYYPYLFSNIDDPHIEKIVAKLFSYLALILVLAGFYMILLSREFIALIAPPEYYSAYKVLICAIPVALFSGINCWVFGILSIVKKTNVIGIVLVFTTGLNLTLNYFLVPMYSWFGAILATTVAYLISVIALFYVAVKSFEVEFEWGRLYVTFKIAIILLLLTITSFYISSYMSYFAIILIPFLPFWLGFFNVEEKAFIKAFGRRLFLI